MAKLKATFKVKARILKRAVKIGSLVALSLLSFSTLAGKVYDSLPAQINPNDTFVFYSHGFIVEGDNPRPIDTRNGWGLYDFPAVKQALADDSYHLVAHHRPKNTDPFEYAQFLNEQIRRLIAAGVKTQNIALVGFSRGAFITGLTSDKLSEHAIDTVILAGCGRLISRKHTDLKVYGDVLSVYEDTDQANTCKKLKDKSTNIDSFTEMEINTGLSHGAFYRPIPEWVKPVKEWLTKTRFKVSNS